MIARLIQKSRLPDRKHSLHLKSGECYGHGGVPSVFNAYLNYRGQNFIIETNQNNQALITLNNTQIGSVSHELHATKKLFAIPIGYEYMKFRVFEHEYFVYESGLGPGKHYFTFYENDRTIAVIHKDDRVINYLNTYTLYSRNDEDMCYASVFTMYLESTAFCDRTGGLGNSIVDSPYYSLQKELRKKFNSEFLKEIIELEKQE